MNTPTTTPAKPPRQRAPKKVTLPTKPSALIRLALRDLAACERKPKEFEIDMATWMKLNGHCKVCLAGAVMVQRFKVKKDFGTWFQDVKETFPQDHEAFAKLNLLRRGAVDVLHYRYGLKTQLTNRNITPYYDSPTDFRRDLLKLARDLEKEGN